MKIIKISKKTIYITTAIILFLTIITTVKTSFGMQHYYNVDFSTGLVTASELNVRSGPGTNYKIVTTIKRGEYIRVFAGVRSWYIVQVEGDYVGAVSKKYVKAIYPSTSGSNNNQNSQNTQTSTTMTADEKDVFNLINKQRTNNGLKALSMDAGAQKVARVKAQDMVDNNYFAHNSPTYGSPFDMLKSFKVSYKTAGENIAGNSTNSGAVNAWMNSSGHKANILNGSYNYTGIGVVSSKKYGKVFVQIFIGK